MTVNNRTSRTTRPDSESQATGRAIFRPFNPEGPLRVYYRNLPHWRQPGTTYFVTFRQADSIPASVLALWLDIRERWYRAHKLDAKLKDSDPVRFAEAYRQIPESIRRAFEREQARMLHEELDRCHGSCVLRFPETRQIVADSLSYFHGQRLWLGDAVVMPNHVHALVTPFDGFELEDLLGSIKKWTGRLIGEWLKTQPVEVRPVARSLQVERNEAARLGEVELQAHNPISPSRAGPVHAKPRFWQHESYDRIVREAEELTAFRRYIARNPETAKSQSKSTLIIADWLDEFAPREFITQP